MTASVEHLLANSDRSEKKRPEENDANQARYRDSSSATFRGHGDDGEGIGKRHDGKRLGKLKGQFRMDGEGDGDQIFTVGR